MNFLMIQCSSVDIHTVDKITTLDLLEGQNMSTQNNPPYLPQPHEPHPTIQPLDSQPIWGGYDIYDN